MMIMKKIIIIIIIIIICVRADSAVRRSVTGTAQPIQNTSVTLEKKS